MTYPQEHKSMARRGRPRGSRTGKSDWENYMTDDEPQIVEEARRRIRQAKLDSKTASSEIGIVRNRCFGRINRQKKARMKENENS